MVARCSTARAIPDKPVGHSQCWAAAAVAVVVAAGIGGKEEVARRHRLGRVENILALVHWVDNGMKAVAAEQDGLGAGWSVGLVEEERFFAGSFCGLFFHRRS